jgi:hypothetical protein
MTSAHIAPSQRSGRAVGSAWALRTAHLGAVTYIACALVNPPRVANCAPGYQLAHKKGHVKNPATPALPAGREV